MRVNQLKAGAALSYTSMIIGYVVSLLYTPIMIRLLGQSEYGLYNLVASVVSYLGIMNFGLGSAYMRYYSEYDKKKDESKIALLNGMFLSIFIVIAIIAVIAGTILAFNTTLIFGDELTPYELNRAKILFMILVVNLAISFPNIVFTSYITANEHFVFLKLVNVLKVLINPFLVLPVLLLGYGSVGLVVVTTFLNFTIELTNILYCFKKLNINFSFKNFDIALLKEMFIFSSYIFMNLIVDQINWTVDKFILGRTHGTIAVAIYGIASQLNTYYISIANNLSDIFIPRVHRLVVNKNNKELTYLFTRIGRIQFFILSLIASGLVFFGKPFIYMWAGENYGDSYLITLLLIIPVTIPLMQTLGIHIQRAMDMHKFRSWLYLFMAFVNLLLTISLSRVYGGIGAAAGTAFAILIGNGLVMNLYNHYKIGLDMKYFWKQILSIFPSIVIPVIFGTLINLFIDLNNIYYFLISGLLYVIIYLIFLWYFGMNYYEKDLIKKPLMKIFSFRT